jgi:hypothetical protein
MVVFDALPLRDGSQVCVEHVTNCLIGAQVDLRAALAEAIKAAEPVRI